MNAESVLPASPQARTGMVRIAVGLLIGTVAFGLPLSAGSSVLIPTRIDELDPGSKVQLLAVVTGAAAVVSLVANVVFGALCDVTRSRFGARTPWIVAGTVGFALLTVPLSRAESFGGLLLWWCLAGAALTATGAGLIAIVPDRVPVTRRATISAVVGVGLLLATALGAVTGSVFADDITGGLRFVAAASVVLAVIAVLVAPDRSNVHAERGRLDLRGLAGAFRFPRKAPDFYLALWGRLLLVLGYFMISAFQLYIFTDYIGLDDDAAARQVGINSILFLVTALPSSAFSGPLSDRLQRRKIFVIAACLLSVLAIAIPLINPTTAGMVAFVCLGGLSFGMYYAVDAALMSEVLPSGGSHARDLGILNIATTGGQALAPAASSLLVMLGVGFTPVFIGALIACALGAALVPPIKSVR